jgi:hypothetical protein
MSGRCDDTQRRHEELVIDVLRGVEIQQRTTALGTVSERRPEVSRQHAVDCEIDLPVVRLPIEERVVDRDSNGVVVRQAVIHRGGVGRVRVMRVASRTEKTVRYGLSGVVSGSAAPFEGAEAPTVWNP